jgi:hypothetical protein
VSRARGGITRASRRIRSQQSAFNAAEQECSSHFPGCGCASHGTTTEENGDGGFYDTTQITVTCDNGKCMTTPK